MDIFYRTASARFVINKTEENCIAAIQCFPDKFQQYKPVGLSYGHLHPRHAKLKPWEDVAVELIGPWNVHLEDGESIEFRALTCIDPVTNIM